MLYEVITLLQVMANDDIAGVGAGQRRVDDAAKALAERDLLQYRTFGYGHSFGVLSHYYGREAGLELRDMFSAFFARGDSFALGVCNGCQMLSTLKDRNNFV